MSAEPALPARPAGGLPLEPARDLSRRLGDPMAGEGPFSYAQIVRHEEAGRLPPGAIELLDDWGFADYLVPATLGGRLVRREAWASHKSFKPRDARRATRRRTRPRATRPIPTSRRPRPRRT